MTCPPQSVNTKDTPSRLSARATTRPPWTCIRLLGPERDVPDVRDLPAHVVGEPLLHAHLDLPHPLSRDAELVADLLQRYGLLVTHERREPPLVDHQVLPLEGLLELVRRLADEPMVLLVGDGLGSVLAARQKIKERGVLVLPDGRVDRDVARREALLHLDHLLLAHVETLSDQLRAGREALALEPLALLGEVEEELALRLRGADLHQAPVVHDVADDVGADPPHRVGREADAAVGVEVLDRLEETDVALLDEVEQVVEGALVLARDHHDQAEVGRDETPCRLPVLVLVPAHGELVLLLAREDGDAADLGEVALERVGGDEGAAPARLDRAGLVRRGLRGRRDLRLGVGLGVARHDAPSGPLPRRQGAPAGFRHTPPRAPRPRPSGGRPRRRPAPAPSGARRGRPARRPSDRARPARRGEAAARSGSPGGPSAAPSRPASAPRWSRRGSPRRP